MISDPYSLRSAARLLNTSLRGGAGVVVLSLTFAILVAPGCTEEEKPPLIDVSTSGRLPGTIPAPTKAQRPLTGPH